MMVFIENNKYNVIVKKLDNNNPFDGCQFPITVNLCITG